MRNHHDPEEEENQYQILARDLVVIQVSILTWFHKNNLVVHTEKQ